MEDVVVAEEDVEEEVGVVVAVAAAVDHSTKAITTDP